MTKDEAKKIVYGCVVRVQGCKATELATDKDLIPTYKDFDLPDLLDEMVAEGSLLEVEYELSTMRGRLKSFFLPGKEDNLLGCRVRLGGRESLVR